MGPFVAGQMPIVNTYDAGEQSFASMTYKLQFSEKRRKKEKVPSKKLGYAP